MWLNQINLCLPHMSDNILRHRIKDDSSLIVKGKKEDYSDRKTLASREKETSFGIKDPVGKEKIEEEQ